MNFTTVSTVQRDCAVLSLDCSLLTVSNLQEKAKGPKERVVLSAATQRSLDRKKR